MHFMALDYLFEVFRQQNVINCISAKREFTADQQHNNQEMELAGCWSGRIGRYYWDNYNYNRKLRDDKRYYFSWTGTMKYYTDPKVYYYGDAETGNPVTFFKRNAALKF